MPLEQAHHEKRRRVDHELRGLQRTLEAAGFVYIRGRTGHIKYRHPSHPEVVVLLASSKPHDNSVKKMQANVRRALRVIESKKAEEES